MRTTSKLGVFAGLVGLLLLPTVQVAGQAPAPQRKLELSFHAGHVTLIAYNVTLREVLAEWGRQGNCLVLNGDKVGSETMVVEFRDQPELSVLQSLLRPVPGYMVEGRRAGSAGASSLQSIRIQPKSGPMTSSYTPPAYNSYSAPSPVAVQLQPADNSADVLPAIKPVPNGDPATPPDPKAAPQPGQPAVIKPFTPTTNGGRGGGAG